MCGAWVHQLKDKVHSYMQRRGIHVACLQETHLAKGEPVKLQRRWRWKVYATAASAFAKEALIWVCPGVPFEAIETRIDTEGRWVLIMGRLVGIEVTL